MAKKKTNYKNRKWAKNRTEAKKIYKARTGIEYNLRSRHSSGLRIYTLTKKSHPKKSKARTHFVGTYMEWINN